jgi:imidazolonepropionase-like amidohydrolase
VVELVAAGVVPAVALASATSAAADACGLGATTGRLRAGLAADLLVVHGDPTVDIADLTRAQRVVLRGREIALPGADRSALSSEQRPGTS